MPDIANSLRRLAVAFTTEKTSSGDVAMTNEGIAFINKDTGAATQVTLPPNPEKGWMVVVVDKKGDSATNNITVIGDNSETIDGGTSYVIAENSGSATFLFDGTEWTVYNASNSPASGAGAKNGTGVVAGELGDDAVHKTVIRFTDHAIALTDEAGVIAYGGSKIYDFPAGSLVLLGATANLALTKSSAGVNDDWDGDFAVGTVTASNNNTLSSTEANIIPSTATPQASSGATTATGRSTAAIFLDGTTTPADLYVNFLVDDADHDVTSTACNLILNGTITVVWTNLGDY